MVGENQDWMIVYGRLEVFVYLMGFRQDLVVWEVITVALKHKALSLTL
jgi:hypothetical protein